MKPRQEEQCLIFGGVNFFPFHAQFVPFAWPDFRISNLSQFFSFWRLIFFPFAWHDFRISGGARFFFPWRLFRPTLRSRTGSKAEATEETRERRRQQQ